MRLVRQRGVLALAFVATVFVCWLLYSVRQQQAQDVFIQGSINTPVVYNARVMPYIIDNDGYCGVPEWLKRGVYVAEKPCDDGVVPVPYGESSWWSVMDAPSGTGHAGVQDKWRTSTVDNNTSLFMHALSECDKGSHMACLIMNVPKGPFHTVKDPSRLLQARPSVLTPTKTPSMSVERRTRTVWWSLVSSLSTCSSLTSTNRTAMLSSKRL